MLIQVFEYKKWADERTLNAIERVDKQLFPSSYSFVLQQLNHMIIVEDLFKSRLANSIAPHNSTNTDLVPDIAELKRRLLASGQWYLGYASELVNTKRAIAFTLQMESRAR